MTTFRIATSSGDGSFSASERDAASGSHLSGSDFNSLAGRSGVTALVGRFNGSALADIALVGGDNWNSIPTALFSESTGTITVTTRNSTVQGFAAAARDASTKKLVGDFDNDHRTDILLLGPANAGTIRVALSDGGGNYRDGSLAVSGHLSAAQFNSLALQPGVKVIVGDYDGDGRSDVALTGGAGWQSIPVAFFRNGAVTTTNFTVGSAIHPWGQWASTDGVSALGGQFGFNNRSDIALTGGPGWQSIPVAHSNGDGTFSVSNTTVGDSAHPWGGWASTAGALKLTANFR